MIRTICGFAVGMVLAFTGVLFFVWLLWRLWKRMSDQAPVPAIEIEAQPPEPAVEVTVESEAEQEVAAKIEKAAETPVAPDDLKRIEGIGPKFSGVLQAAGILTYAQLAAATPGELDKILEAEDPRLSRLADPTSWPEQAALAAAGDWEALKALQDTLKGGRRA